MYARLLFLANWLNTDKTAHCTTDTGLDNNIGCVGKLTLHTV